MEDKEIQIAGVLFWEDFAYDLIDPHPYLDKEHWMTDQDEKFKVIRNGRIFDVIVSRPFQVSRQRMGERVKLLVKEVTVEDINWLDSVLADEPLSLAE